MSQVIDPSHAITAISEKIAVVVLVSLCLCLKHKE